MKKNMLNKKIQRLYNNLVNLGVISGYFSPAISHHLQILKKAKIISMKKVEIKKGKQLTGEEKAWRMLEKMGWKGKGLGKYEQGIVIPLIGKKTSKNHGLIINVNTEDN